ncbi:MAG TPA: 3-hydroxybutyrate dehydrogenase [Ramlibacter sp.]|uniref:3-hydroxybutyrate dehydrogenase n=1 Tax=Ramlibacter sp. TaxID=1917967 RepID=UPI002C62A6E4|nr:3-hydroxybutyrate dehydrogenase [Ramlibacter sp.]HVZ42648.1 3-hydroxybutyrate dehydrogenase [Ramlibacter sp.]
MDATLQSRCALVTGSTQGIGRAIAHALAGQGCHVVLHGIEPEAEGLALAAEIAQTHGVRAAYVPCDLSQAAAAAQLVDRAESALLPLDILVNNAGIQFIAPIEAFPLERWEAIHAINLRAPFLLMQDAVARMRRRGGGRIVNIASVHGLVASTGRAPYVAAKHGLVGLSKAVALETATDRITVNCVCPGLTDTEILAAQMRSRAAREGIPYEEALDRFIGEKQPSRALLAPSAIAKAVLFLCGDGAEHITGVALPVDGGWTAQ